MRKIGIINYKGGTGKTSTVVNLAHGLAMRGKKVLLIDTDPQGSVGYHIGVNSKRTLYDLLIKDATVESCVVQARPNLDVILSNEHLFPASIILSNLNNRELVLKERLANVSGYDFILLDCAPSMSLLTQNALLFSEEILIPVSMEYLSLTGVKQLLNNVQLLSKLFNHPVSVTAVVPTFFDLRNKKSKDILESLNRVFPGKVSSPIRFNVSISEASGYKQTVFEYDPNSKGAEDYQKLIEEVIGNGKSKKV